MKASRWRYLLAAFLTLGVALGEDATVEEEDDYDEGGGESHGPGFQEKKDDEPLSPEDIAWVEAQKAKVMEMRRQGKSNLNFKYSQSC